VNHFEPDSEYLRLVREARDALRAGRPIEADRLARSALALDPIAGDAYNLLALVFERRGDQLRAQDLLRAALAVAPRHRAAMKNLERLTRSGLNDLAPSYGDEESRP
jgi:Flp pilus assembly protein TadD